MYDTSTPLEPAQRAVELMTAWAASPEGPPDLMLDCLRRLIDDRPQDERPRAAAELIMGMTCLCGSVLALFEESSGLTPQQTLRQLALHYATL
jgi:hypothetical protein